MSLGPCLLIECSSCNCGRSTGGSVIPVAVPAVRCDYCGSGLVVYRRGGLFAISTLRGGFWYWGLVFVEGLAVVILRVCCGFARGGGRESVCVCVCVCACCWFYLVDLFVIMVVTW